MICGPCSKGNHGDCTEGNCECPSRAPKDPAGNAELYPPFASLTIMQRVALMFNTGRLWDTVIANQGDGPGLCSPRCTHCCGHAHKVVNAVLEAK